MGLRRQPAPAGCPECQAAFHHLLGYDATAWPDGRIALVSSKQDQVIAQFFGIGGWQFQQGLEALADGMAPLPNARVFLLPGNGHVWLAGNLAAVTAGGTSLAARLEAQVTGGAGWTNVR